MKNKFGIVYNSPVCVCMEIVCVCVHFHLYVNLDLQLMNSTFFSEDQNILNF